MNKEKRKKKKEKGRGKNYNDLNTLNRNRVENSTFFYLLNKSQCTLDN